MTWVTQVLSFFGNYTPIISFVGAIIGGEETLIFLSILASQGFLNLLHLFIFFYLGIMTSDAIWYFIGKSRFFDWLIKRRIISKTFLHWDRILNRATRKSDFQALLFTKFLYGTRIPTLMYLSKKRLTIRSFLIYSIITNFLWVSVIILIGWSAGKGISLTTNISENIVLYLFLIGITLVLFMIFVRVLAEITQKWLTKKQKQ